VAELIARAEAVYGERREQLLGCLSERGVPARGSSGLNVWIEVPDEVGVIGRLSQSGWVLAGGSRYRLPGSAPGVRVTVATLLAEESEQLAEDIASALAPAGSVRGG
jgi:DNA-binding transcriptional MocR family regulator